MVENLVLTEKAENFFRYPSVNFNAETGICLISGESFMEDSKAYYTQMMEWFGEFYETQKEKPIVFNIRLDYFNTSSSKMLYELLKRLQEYNELGQKISINWYYDANDTDLEEEIMDISFDVDIEINRMAE